MIPRARPSPLKRVIRSTRRRMLWVRLIEGIGLGTLIASLFALALIVVLYLHETTDVLLPIIASLILGAVAGFFWAWARRPTALDAAIVADRQLGLSDLLATALLLGDGSADPWHQSVLAKADICANQIRFSRLLLHRMGARAWGATGLVGTLVLTLAFLVGSTTQMHADDRVRQSRAFEQPAEEQSEHPLLAMAPDASLRRPSAPPEAEDAGQPHQGDVETRNDDQPKTQHADQGDGDITRPHGGEPLESQGSGSAKTQTPQRDMKEPWADRQAPTDPSAANASAPSGAGGGPEASVAPDQEGATRAARAGHAARTPFVPPWNSDDWLSDVAAARAALQNERLDPTYRPIVRDYFRINP